MLSYAASAQKSVSCLENLSTAKTLYPGIDDTTGRIACYGSYLGIEAYNHHLRHLWQLVAHNQCKGATTARPNFVFSQTDEVWGWWWWIFEALLGKQLSMTTSFSSFSVFKRLRFIFLLSIYRCKFSKMPPTSKWTFLLFHSLLQTFHQWKMFSSRIPIWGVTKT